MFHSLHMKLTLILLVLICSLMAVVGAFLTISISSFYTDSFYEQVNEVFGEGNADFVFSLQDAAGQSIETMQEMLDASAGRLGIDYVNRNFYILDSSGSYLAGSADAASMPGEQTPNLLAARNGQTGDGSDLTAEYMDVAIPIPGADGSSYIIYIYDSRAQVSRLNSQMFSIVAQAILIGVLISFLLSFLLSQTMVGPLEKLTAGAERIASGDFGSRLPVASNDEIGTLTGTFNEMSRVLKKTLDAVENERNKLDTLFLHMTDGVVAFSHDGHLIHCNPAATAMLSRTVSPECTYEELFGSSEPHRSFQEMLRLQRPNYAEAELKAGDRTLELYLAPFSDSDEDSGGVLIVLHDVTEHHRNEERRKEFVANVSHELRTPLTNVRSYAETLRDAEGDIPQDMQNSFLDIIITETDRMTRIVQDLLTLSRLDAGNTEMNFTRFPFGEAIEGVCLSNALEAKRRGHTLECDLEEELPLVVGDRSRLEEVMMNIVGNSVKYTPDGGHILVTAGVVGDRVWMEVRDDGIGIPEQDRERIFERFYRVDKARSRESGGTGLGLSIAKEIVDRHHGTIQALAHEGPGTTVRMELPIRQTDETL